MALWRILYWFFGAGPVLFVTAIGISGGLTLALAPQVRNIRLAHWFFGFAWLWAFGGAIEVFVDMKLPLKTTVPLVFISTGLVGVLAFLCFVWVESNHQETVATTTVKPKSSSRSDSNLQPNLSPLVAGSIESAPSKPLGKLNHKGEEHPYLKSEKPKYDPTKRTLHDLFRKDFNVASLDTTMHYTNGTNHRQYDFEVRLFIDPQANTKYIAAYVPESVADETYNLCASFSDGYKQLLDGAGLTMVVGSSMPGEEMMWSKDSPFSGRIFIYHQFSLDLQQKAQLEQIYKMKNLAVQFRGFDYLGTKRLSAMAEQQAKPQ